MGLSLREIFFLLLLCNLPLFSQQTSPDYLVLKNGKRLVGSITFLETPLGFGSSIRFHDSLDFSFHDIDTICYKNHILVFNPEINPGSHSSRYQFFLLKNLVNDSINIYTHISDLFQLHNKTNYEYFSTGKTGIQKISFTTLAPVLGGKPASVKYVALAKRYRFWEKTLLISGTVSLLYGILRTKPLKREFDYQLKEFKYHTDFHPAVFISLALFTGSYIFHSRSRMMLEKGIDAYNQNE